MESKGKDTEALWLRAATFELLKGYVAVSDTVIEGDRIAAGELDGAAGIEVSPLEEAAECRFSRGLVWGKGQFRPFVRLTGGPICEPATVRTGEMGFGDSVRDSSPDTNAGALSERRGAYTACRPEER